MKKKFSETKVGAFLKEKAPTLLKIIGDTFPPIRVLTKLVETDNSMSPDEKLELEKLINDTYLKELEYHLSNTESAREMYSNSKDMTDKISNQIMSRNHILLFLMIIISILVHYFFESRVIAIVTQLIGVFMGQLISELNTVINFYLGSMKKESNQKFE